MTGDVFRPPDYLIRRESRPSKSYTVSDRECCSVRGMGNLLCFLRTLRIFRTMPANLLLTDYFIHAEFETNFSAPVGARRSGCPIEKSSYASAGEISSTGFRSTPSLERQHAQLQF